MVPDKLEVLCNEFEKKPLKNTGVFLESYILGKFLGEGAHSRVFLCEHKLTVSRYAVKILEKRILKED